MDNELKNTFTQIYKTKIWGEGSGQGSTDEIIVNTYINDISVFLKSLNKKPKIVDLGCGDFNIGSKIIEYSSEYVACDIVEFIIEENKKKYFDANVEFQVLDISKDDLPLGDVAIIRQVLQHLSNKKINNILKNIYDTYQYIIITEHIPKDKFIPNIDMSSGNKTRIELNSGVVVTESPFSLKIKDQKLISSITLGDTVLKTLVYQLH